MDELTNNKDLGEQLYRLARRERAAAEGHEKTARKLQSAALSLGFRPRGRRPKDAPATEQVPA
jgi:hypothetical protein